MRGIEDDRRPPRGRLDHIERRRQFTVRLGHRPAPSFAAAWSGRWIVPDKSGFHEDLLSGVTTDLPSKKSFARPGTLFADEKTQRFIDSTAVPAQNGRCFHLAAAFHLHPKFTTHRLSGWIDPPNRIRHQPPCTRLLLAEDDNDMRRFLVKALENAGFSGLAP